MTTKEDVYKGFQSIGNFVTAIGNTIKENKRQKQIQKVLSEFNNPDKIFLNVDGTPKTDAEIAPILNQGVMSLYQLGEDKLANSLTEYFGTMSKSFDKTSQNAFNYEGNVRDERFPTDEQGNPSPFNPRVDYPDWTGTKQYKPAPPKSKYGFRVVDMKGIDGSGEVKYYREDKETGLVEEITSSEYTKKINESRGYVYHDSPDRRDGAAFIKDKDGNLLGQTVIKGGKVMYNGKYITVEEYNKATGNVVEQTSTGFTDPTQMDNQMNWKEVGANLVSIVGDKEIAKELIGYYGTPQFWDKLYEAYAKAGKILQAGSTEHQRLWDFYQQGLK